MKFEAWIVLGGLWWLAATVSSMLVGIAIPSDIIDEVIRKRSLKTQDIVWRFIGICIAIGFVCMLIAVIIWGTS